MTVEDFIKTLPPAVRELINGADIATPTAENNLEAIEGFLEQGEALSASLNTTDAVKETVATLYAKSQVFYMFDYPDAGDRFDDQTRHYLKRYNPAAGNTPTMEVESDDQIFTSDEFEKWWPDA